MDLTNQQIHFIGYASTAQETLDRADSIIALAEKNNKEASTLAACATILLAAALEQGVQSVLTEAGENSAVDEDVDVKDTKHSPFYEASKWHRIKSLPSLLSDDRFRLDRNHILSQALRELIKTRNNLVHIEEKAVHLVGPNDQIRVENNRVVVSFPVPLNPWGSVSRKSLKRYREAVDAYFREVLFPEGGQINAGQIVIPSSS